MKLIKESFSSYDPQSGEYEAQINIFGKKAELYGEVNVHLIPNVGQDKDMFGGEELEEVNLELNSMYLNGQEIIDRELLNIIQYNLILCRD